MGSSLLDRARELIASKKCAAALAIVPLATVAARPVRGQATVLFGFGAAEMTGGVDSPTPLTGFNGSTSGDGYVHVNGSKSAFQVLTKGGQLPMGGSGGIFAGGSGGGGAAYDALIDLKLSGAITGALTTSSVLVGASNFSANVSTGTLTYLGMTYNGFAGFLLNASDLISPPSYTGQAISVVDQAISTSTSGSGGGSDGNWEMHMYLGWSGFTPGTDTVSINVPSATLGALNNPPTWNHDAGGDWTTAGNWTGGVPNGVDSVASFLDAITTARTITTSAPITLGGLRFNNANSYVLAGTGSIRMQTSAGKALIDVEGGGTAQINLPLTIASDTMIANNSSLVVSGAVTVNAGKTLTCVGDASTFSGAISNSGVVQMTGGTLNAMTGPGSLLKFGSGQAVLTGNATHTGGTTIRGGTLQIGNGGTSGALAGDVVNNGTLLFHRSDLVTFAGLISEDNSGGGSGGGFGGSGGGFGLGQVVQDMGIVVLTNANTYSGGTVLTAGTLRVNNSTGSGTGSGPVQVNGGTLSGTGSIDGAVTINAGGHLNPGAAAGTLTGNAGLTLNDGAAVDFDLANTTTPGAGVNDLLNLTGDLNLFGNVAVNLNAYQGDLTSGTYKLITYTGFLNPVGLFNVGTSNAATSHLFTISLDNPGEVDLIVSSGSATWLGGAGNWSTSAKWASALIPNNPGLFVKIDNGNATASSVTLDQDATVANITLDAADTFTVPANKTLTVAGGVTSTFAGVVNDSGMISVANGRSRLLGGGTGIGSFTIASGATLEFGGGTHTLNNSIPFSGVGSIAVTGGKVNLPAGLYLGGPLLSLSGGTLAVTGDEAVGNGLSATVTQTGGTHTATSLTVGGGAPGSYTLSAGGLTVSSTTLADTGTFTFGGGTFTPGSLTLTGSGALKMSSGGGKVLKTPAVSISDSASIDVSDNKLIVTGASIGSISGGSYTGITGLIASGRGGGNWTGPGIVTSQSNAKSPSVLTSLAIATAGSVGKSTFGGVSVSMSDVLVMYTYGGDANLDGKLNGDDYFLIDSHVNLTGAFGWRNGDFNYDGHVNGDDYFIIDSNINHQTLGVFPSSAGTGGVTAVPEPAAMTAVVGWLAAHCGRRRRSPLDQSKKSAV